MNFTEVVSSESCGIKINFEELAAAIGFHGVSSPVAASSALSGAVPTPEEILQRAAEIRRGWTMSHRRKARVSDERAAATDREDSFVWPTTWSPAGDVESEGDEFSLDSQGLVNDTEGSKAWK